MEKIEEFDLLYSKFDNLSQRCEFVRPVKSPSIGRLQTYVYLTLFTLLITACSRRVNGKLKTLYDVLNLRGINCNLFIKPIYYLLSLLVLPIFVIILTAFVIIKQVVNIILKLKYGNDFGGILKSADSVWAIEDTSRNIINILILLKFKTDKIDTVIDQIKQAISDKIFQNSENFPKLTCVRHRFLGYNFLLKNELTVDDCVSPLKFELDTELNQWALQEIISKCSNQPLPNQHTALWEILVSPVPLKWKSREETMNCYPVLLRFSHIVGDGLSFTNLMLRTFANNSTQEICRNNSFEKLYINNSSENILRKHNDVFVSKAVFFINYIMSLLNIILTAPAIIVHQHLLRKDDDNSLHGPELSGEKVLVYAVEEEKAWFKIVKDAKTNIPDCKFSDILFAAISGSLDGHFKRNSQPIPKCVSTVIPALLSPPSMDKEPVLQNQFSIGILDLPVQMNNSSMLHRLQEIMKYTSKFRNSPQYQVNYWLVTYLCGFIPHPVLQHSLKTDQLTMTISNVPGVSKVTIMEDCDIEDIVFFTNHRGKTGLGFSILTYNNRFQLGLTVDKSILPSKAKAQLLINDVFKNVELLQTEVCGRNVSRKT